MTRERAGERFGLLWALGWLLGVAMHLADVPRPAGLAVASVWFAALAWSGGRWLMLALRDGSLRRALPDYGWAFLSLLLIAVGSAALTVPVLLGAREPLEPTSVSTGAALGTFAFLLVWWALNRPRGHGSR